MKTQNTPDDDNKVATQIPAEPFTYKQLKLPASLHNAIARECLNQAEDGNKITQEQLCLDLIRQALTSRGHTIK